MIKTTNLTKRYGKFEALSDFSLDVARGEIMALVGPNGAGKTTALKLLVGLLTPSAGDIWIGGYHVYRQSLEVKRICAFIPDQPFLYEQLTVVETMAFIGGMYRIDAALLQERANELLELFGLAPYANRRVGQLSYGTKSRLALALALLHEPQVLIMDEPFFGLDPQTLRLMKDLLLQRSREGMSILLSTHQLNVVEDLAHRITIIGRGRLISLGTWDELKRLHGGSRLEDIFLRLTGNSTGNGDS